MFIIKMIQLIQNIFNIQKHKQIYQGKVTIIEIHPLMKSLVGLI
jgi:hypothetical protein